MITTYPMCACGHGADDHDPGDYECGRLDCGCVQFLRARGTTSALVTVSDETANDEPITVERGDVVDRIRGWFAGAPDDVVNALDRLDTALARHEQTLDFEAYLAIRIEPADDDDVFTYLARSTRGATR